MGNFDGYLICSDLDGTFLCGGKTAEVNSEAVKYFTDNGGRFTFATGRSVSYLSNSDLFNNINAPACLYNGGIIYDYEKENVLFERRTDFTVQDFIEVVDRQLKETDDIIIYHDCMSTEGSICHIKDISSELLGIKPIKIVCVFKSVNDANGFKQFARRQKLFNSCYISKSWNVSVEFNDIEATKGRGLAFIKKHLGNIHTAIGIGDYENDIPLLKHADIGVAVGDAVDELKKISDITVKPGPEYAIRDLVEIIETRIR